MHWCLAVIDPPEKRIVYFDSLGDQGIQCRKHLFQSVAPTLFDFVAGVAVAAMSCAVHRYLQDEHQDKRKAPMDTSGWDISSPADKLPQQRNGFDCGVFLCIFADYFTAGRVSYCVSVQAWSRVGC